MSLMQRIRHALGIKEDAEVAAEVQREPTVREAREAVQRADRILHELEIVEQLPRRRSAFGRRSGDRFHGL